MEKSKELLNIEKTISDLYMVFNAERERLYNQYEVEKKCLYAKDVENAKELFNKKFPTVEKYIEEERKIRTIADAYLILDLIKK